MLSLSFRPAVFADISCEKSLLTIKIELSPAKFLSSVPNSEKLSEAVAEFNTKGTILAFGKKFFINGISIYIPCSRPTAESLLSIWRCFIKEFTISLFAYKFPNGVCHVDELV